MTHHYLPKFRTVLWIGIACVLLSLSQSARAQTYGQMITRGNAPGVLYVPAGCAFEYLSGNSVITMSGGTSETLMVYHTNPNMPPVVPSIAAGRLFSGPLTITTKLLNVEATAVSVMSYRIHGTETNSFTSPYAVVIPENAGGAVNIILESSTDLITWTAATPGTYGASTPKRFFRVRAVTN